MTPSPVLQSYLDLISFAEGTNTGLDNGYGVIVSGVDGPHSFTDYSDHPFAGGRPAIEVVAPGIRFPKGLYSTASGRYQLILPTWKALKGQLGLTDFTPYSQDAACIQLLVQHGATALILDGKIQEAIQVCSKEWASFPGSTAGQGGKTMGSLLTKWEELSQVP